MKKNKFTPYQEELIGLVRAGSPTDKDEPIDFDQLLQALSWRPTKESAQFSIRALVKRQVLKKCEELKLRRGRKRVCFELDTQGKLLFDPRGPVEAEAPKPAVESLDLALEDPRGPLPGLEEDLEMPPPDETIEI